MAPGQELEKTQGVVQLRTIVPISCSLKIQMIREGGGEDPSNFKYL